MKCAGQISEKDYVAAQWLHLRLRPVFRVLGFLLLVLWVVALCGKFSQGFENTVDYVFAFITFYMLLLFGFSIPRKWKRIYRNYKLIQAPFEWVFTKERIFSKTAHSEAYVDWDAFIKWRVGKKYVLLYQASNLMNIIPKEGFVSDEDFAAALELFKEKLGKPV
ncbi:YcxB family protein [Kiritimatiellaeota bacterium B1221]|nr:YcxB family protein [Kiritimatiellaeota bacterium B1221]